MSNQQMRTGEYDKRGAGEQLNKLKSQASDQSETPDDANDTPEAVLQEAAREHQDTYLVKSDLEDADQRSIPGTREQP